ncbi:MAG: chemotaxis protein CheX [Planctomycetota bacterium]
MSETLTGSCLERMVEAARETLALMAALEEVAVTYGAADAVAQVHEVSAVIGFGGPEAQGALVLSTDRVTATRLVSRIAGAELEELSEDVVDGLGELANIVAGRAAVGLGGGEDLGLALPTVVAGGGHRVFRTRGVDNRFAFLQTPDGPLCLQVHVRAGAA